MFCHFASTFYVIEGGKTIRSNYFQNSVQLYNHGSKRSFGREKIVKNQIKISKSILREEGRTVCNNSCIITFLLVFSILRPTICLRLSEKAKCGFVWVDAHYDKLNTIHRLCRNSSVNLRWPQYSRSNY